MKARLSLIIAGAALLLVLLPGTASAFVVDYSVGSCNVIWNELGNPKPFVCFAEDDDYGGNKLIFTASSDFNNLGTLAHRPSGHCSPKTPLDTDNWNDCVTSVWGVLGTTDSVCLFKNAGYGQRFARWSTPSFPAGSVTTFFDDDLGLNSDVLSSVSLTQSGAQCS